jgi:5-methyltetrahydrofolate--homocysteine methyltransferase
MDWAAKAAERYRAACGLPVMVQPNAGLPVVKNQVTTYPQTPAEMAACLPGVVEAGASIIGGCCGSTPVHIAALREGLDALLPQEEDEKN